MVNCAKAEVQAPKCIMQGTHVTYYNSEVFYN